MIYALLALNVIQTAMILALFAEHKDTRKALDENTTEALNLIFNMDEVKENARRG